MAHGWFGVLVCSVCLAQTPDFASLAYEALRARDYDRAILRFRAAIDAAPDRAALRKDLAYTYLKVGDIEAARDEFGEAMRLDPADTRSALEYAFLCNDTRRTAEARRIFDRLRKSADPQARTTAEQAFQNIDRPLAEDLARWSEAVAQSPGDFSAQRELARLAEQRDMLDVAAEHYRKAWQIRPAERSLLLDLGRVWKVGGHIEQANTALLAASRGSPARVAEEARELLPSHYPYVAEFRQALELDPGNTELRRDLAYLLLQMGRAAEAEAEFERITQTAPEDDLSAAQLGLLRLARQDKAGAMPLLERAMKSGDSELAARVRAALGLPPDLRPRPPSADGHTGAAVDAKEMAERSFRAGYLKDALRYFQAAYEADPLDFPVMLKLGWTYNLLHQDELAMRWFDLARRSPDAAIAQEADKAYRNLRPDFKRFRTTAWVLPFYSTRWSDTFSYGQVKTEVRIGSLPFRPYLSMRFIGDTRGATGEAPPQYLSESSFILAVGAASRSWHGVTLWGEAGQAISYLSSTSQGRMLPDYRGGAAYGRGAGRLFGSTTPGRFAETHEDGVFISRFDNDFLIYSQNRAGYTLREFHGVRSQVYVNGNFTGDVKRQYWANFVELGPGLRFRTGFMPQSVVFSVDALRGAYTLNQDNPRRPNFFDVRAGFWYALSR